MEEIVLPSSFITRQEKQGWDLDYSQTRKENMENNSIQWYVVIGK